MTPNQYATKAVTALKQSADPRVASQFMKYFKPHEKIQVLGVSTPAVRKIEKHLAGQVLRIWGVKDAIACCDLLLKSRFLECRAVGLLTLSRFREAFPRNLVDRVESWFMTGRCDNWASCDSMCGSVLAPLLFKYPDILQKLNSWTSSDCLWLRRAAAVSLTPLAKKGLYLDEAFRIASALLGDTEDLIHKATGWLLREAGKTDEQRLESFLLAHGPQVPRTALRYAIERLGPHRRAFVLSQTKR